MPTTSQTEEHQCSRQSISSDTDSEDEVEYKYENYGIQTNGAYMVAGGGMGNGNAYATVEKKDGRYYYCEYGRFPCRHDIGDTITWSEGRRNDGCGEFNID